MDPSAFESVTGSTFDSHHSLNNHAALEHSAQCRNKKGWRRVVLNFTPSWFAVTMGTGIVSILLHNLPYNSNWIYWISVVIFALNVFLFVLFTLVSLVRYAVFRGVWSCMTSHPVQSLFLGTFPMGLSTIINMICFLGSITAAWLLPIVATIVAAASGGIVASVLENVQHAWWTVVFSYVMWGCGVSLAMIVLVVYFTRLTLHDLPPREVIVSVFLPLGPFGQGAFGIMQLGKVSMDLFPKTNSIPAAPFAGQILYTVGIMIALLMWGAGLAWLFFAVASISRSKFPFNIGWWGFTFPLGVYTVATTTLAQELPSLFFKVLGTIFSLTVVVLWIIVASRTIERSWSGEIFKAPCIKTWEEEQIQKAENKDEEARESTKESV
ncbi:hypothetical protein EJ05DRAFT_461677 [Pseudovirgaria hyperparasitica]|uniref:Sulfite efflux pump SSU1 n=1 Tax=Pseudovirgaria hyperparasitica TaxID=470096 RepID=A0A6A6WIM0_9PEZI|nr:uncharacterized protein EJ05DRAFT_461677 [Pseudovirgaria hyperparasitica]KAF2761031.1 hypothetical protein EJ05DRAFT_461677 [Pseudovirgaria hyperparasitica]